MSSLDRNIADLSLEEQRALLAQLLSEESAATTTFPLSFNQQRLWFLDQLGAGAAYNLPLTLQLEGKLDVESLAQALKEIVQRHAILRTIYQQSDGQPQQVITADATLPLPITKLQHLPANQQAEVVHRLSQEVMLHPFDLARDRMLRVQLVCLAADQHLLLVCMHHIASDGWSIGVFMRELVALYAAFANKQPSPLPELPIQYVDFAHWQRQQLQGNLLETLLAYWNAQLAGAPAILELPTDRPRPAQQTFRGGQLPLTLSGPLTQQLRRLGQQAGTTLYTVLLSAFQILLARYTGQTDIVVGAPFANRLQEEVEPLIGFFVNTLVLRTSLDDNLTFCDLLARVHAMAQAAYLHQDVPFERLVDELISDRNLSYPPVVQVLFALQSNPLPLIEIPGLRIRRSTPSAELARMDLEMTFWELEDELHGTCVYNADLFDAATIQRMLQHFHVLLSNIVATPNQPIKHLPMLTAAEYHQIVHEWNDTTVDFGEPQTIHALFEQQVARTPNAVALVFENKQLTYRELNERANQLAHHLIELGVGNPLGADTLVAVLMERSLGMVVSLLAVLKAGGAYVPIDPTYPSERIHAMITDARVCILLTQSQHDLRTQMLGTVLYVDQDKEIISLQSTENPQRFAKPHHLAYVIYTSGSTGTPKGVMVEHRNVVNYVNGVVLRFDLKPQASFALAQSLQFDLGLTMLYPALLTGGKLHILNAYAAQDPSGFSSYLRQHAIDYLKITPSHLSALIDDHVDIQVALILGGEAADTQWVARVQAANPHLQIFNHYGPTETTVGVVTHKLRSTIHKRAIPIGQALPNNRTLILNTQLQPVPTGIAGELYIGGAQLARGYLNRPELTAERFIEHPRFGRLYKTGDLCRWLPAPAGERPNIEYLGRTDFQVKLRGFRIELGEIENALLAQEGVREAVVLAREDKPGDKRLVAYLIGEANRDTLRQQLAQRLPDYMVPSAFVTLDHLPLTPHGKLDRRALPAPDYADAQTAFVAPRNAIEAQVAAIWASVLGIEQASPEQSRRTGTEQGRSIGIYDNFFALGGHSLLATQVISRVRTQLDLEVPLKALFEAPQLAGFAHIISQRQTSPSAMIRRIIQPMGRDGQIPLSFAQQRLWFLDQLEPNSAFYNSPKKIRLTGSLDMLALEQSFTYLIERHESLRTTFEIVDGEPIQVIHAPYAFRLPVVIATSEEQAQALAHKETITPFNLREDPLLRARLFKLAEREHLLVITIHHITGDGWSTGVLVKELSQAYTAYVQGAQPALPVLPIQYADFALWQRQYLRGATLERQLSFWREQLMGAPALLELPTDRPRPPVQSYRGAHYAFQLEADLTVQLKQLAQAQDATLFMLLLTAFNILLARYSRQTDIVVGTLIANRHHAEIEGIIGFFLNILVLRTQLDDASTFTSLLKQVRQNTLAAYEHQDLSFEQLVDALQPQRTLSYHPLFQVMLILQNAFNSTFNLPNLKATLQQSEFPFARFDLTLDLTESKTGLAGRFEYSTDLFDEATIARMADHFTVLLRGIVSHPDQPVLHLPLLTAAEYQQIVHEWNAPKGRPTVNWGEGQTIHALFEQQVERTPDAVAVVMDVGEQGARGKGQVNATCNLQPATLTYAELNARANQLAHHLQRLGVGPDVLVGICVERSMEMVIGLLGILKAGGVYVPLDPTYPNQRLQWMIQEAQIHVLLTQQCFVSQLPTEGVLLLSLDSADQPFATASKENPKSNLPDNQLLYVIYTSGSTGNPKGAEVYHHSFINLLHWFITEFALDGNDSVLLISSPSFDLTQKNIFAPLLVGGCLHLIKEYDPEQIIKTILRHKISWINCTPSAFYPLIEGDNDQPATQLHALRYLFLGGEPIAVARLQKWRQADGFTTKIVNTYGPTECADICASYVVEQGFTNNVVPIGRPIYNVQLLILDQAMQPTPIGIAGELWIGGAGVGRGYLNRPDLTAERFIEHPVFGRLYKTGDLCRWLPDGNIEYLGRTDFQVKIRGFRIELGEIEKALLAQDGVREVVALAREDKPGDKRLAAYLVQDARCKLQIETLRTSLQQKLPDYMIPSAFVLLEKMPLTPNGKLDRRALPAPDFAGVATAHTPAETLDETRLVLLWQALLGVHPIGVEDNFFELGGHSLLATQLVQQMRQTLQRNLSVQQLFKSPTIRGLLGGLAEAQTASPPFVTLRTGDKGMSDKRSPMFLFPPSGGLVFPYSTLLPHLSLSQPMYALQARGIYDDLPPFESVEALATATIQEMKRIQAHGPYKLGGWSFGGMVAFEIAQQLTQQGDTVSFLGLMDSYPLIPEQATRHKMPTPQAELQAFLYLLGDVMGSDYRCLSEEIFVKALEDEQPIEWLLAQMSGQGHRLVLDPAIVKRIWLTLKHNSQLMQAYQPQPYKGCITVFCAEESAPAAGIQRWQALTPHPVDAVWVSGEHQTMLNMAHVEKLGRELEKRLQAIGAR